MHIKPPDDRENHHLHESTNISNKMVNMNGTQIEPADEPCLSVRNSLEHINSCALPTSSTSTNPVQLNGYQYILANPHVRNSLPTNTIHTQNYQNNNHISSTINDNYNGQSMNSLQVITSYPLLPSRSIQSLTVALIYYREVSVGGQTKSRKEQELPVGTLVIDRATCKRMTARQLREKIQKDIPHEYFNDFNTDYVFLTRQG